MIPIFCVYKRLQKYYLKMFWLSKTIYFCRNDLLVAQHCWVGKNIFIGLILEPVLFVKKYLYFLFVHFTQKTSFCGANRWYYFLLILKLLMPRQWAGKCSHTFKQCHFTQVCFCTSPNKTGLVEYVTSKNILIHYLPMGQLFMKVYMFTPFTSRYFVARH